MVANNKKACNWWNTAQEKTSASLWAQIAKCYLESSQTHTCARGKISAILIHRVCTYRLFERIGSYTKWCPPHPFSACRSRRLSNPGDPQKSAETTQANLSSKFLTADQSFPQYGTSCAHLVGFCLLPLVHRTWLGNFASCIDMKHNLVI